MFIRPLEWNGTELTTQLQTNIKIKSYNDVSIRTTLHSYGSGTIFAFSNINRKNITDSDKKAPEKAPEKAPISNLIQLRIATAPKIYASDVGLLYLS
jgi:hypothetical protein